MRFQNPAVELLARLYLRITVASIEIVAAILCFYVVRFITDSQEDFALNATEVWQDGHAQS